MGCGGGAAAASPRPAGDASRHSPVGDARNGGAGWCWRGRRGCGEDGDAAAPSTPRDGRAGASPQHGTVAASPVARRRCAREERKRRRGDVCRSGGRVCASPLEPNDGGAGAARRLPSPRRAGRGLPAAAAPRDELLPPRPSRGARPQVSRPAGAADRPWGRAAAVVAAGGSAAVGEPRLLDAPAAVPCDGVRPQRRQRRPSAAAAATTVIIRGEGNERRRRHGG